MDLNSATQLFGESAKKATGIDKSLKFKLDIGVIHLDFTGDQPVVSNEDKEADCTITTSMDTLEAIRKGEQNPMMAVMTGKVKIAGDMSLAMKLQSLMG